jgi:hypothetical protein
LFWNPGYLLLTQKDVEDDFYILEKLIRANKDTTIKKLSDYSYFDIQMYLESSVYIVDDIIEKLVKTRR